MDKISVVIPVYNVEQYTRKCLDSVINQTHTNLEILLVDDGSTDNSGEICDEYARNDKRVQVFHQSNQGVSAARNVGLKNAAGLYIGFVDSDDWIEPNMYELLYDEIIKTNASISVCNYFKDTANNSIAFTNQERIPQRILSAKEMLLFSFRTFYYAGFEWSVCNKLFSRPLILNAELCFDTNLKYGEDAAFFIKYILTTKNSSGVFIDNPLYHYYQRAESAMHTKHIKNMIEWLKCDKQIIKLIDSYGYEDICVWVKRDYCYKASLIAEEAIKGGNQKLTTLMQDEMKLYLGEYIETNKEYSERINRICALLNAEL